LAYLTQHRNRVRVILVEQTDRLYRNIKDWSTLDEFGVSIHFVKGGTIIGPESRSSDQFVHGIKVLMARNYSLNISEETVKGMAEKARAGIYPSCAPFWYVNVDGPNGKRVITPHPTDGPVVTQLFELFARGHYSLKGIVVLANLEVADKLAVAFLPSIPLFASVGGAGGGFLGFLSQSHGASV